MKNLQNKLREVNRLMVTSSLYTIIFFVSRFIAPEADFSLAKDMVNFVTLFWVLNDKIDGVKTSHHLLDVLTFNQKFLGLFNFFEANETN